MTQSVTFSELSRTLKSFNDALNESEKLDANALQTIQNYLNDPRVTTIDREDQEKMQRPLQQLEKLREQATYTRVSSTTMKKINSQLKNLAEILIKKSEETMKDAYFTIIRLEVCFLGILTEEAAKSSKHWHQIYEEKMAKSEVPEYSHQAQPSRACYLDKQQHLISELMNAVLFNVMEYFQKTEELFSKHFTQQLLDLFEEKAKNPKFPLHNKISDDVFKILSETAQRCKLSMIDLIYHLKYAMIGFGEQTNEFTRPLQNYITNTTTPTLTEFNKTIDSTSALTLEEVNQFTALFDLYCQLLLSPLQEVSQNLEPNVFEACTDTKSSSISSEPTAVIERDILQTIAKTNITPKITNDPSVRIAKSKHSSTSSKEKLLPTTTYASASSEMGQPELPAPPIECESDVKFVWIVSENVEDHYQDYKSTIDPACSIHFDATELLSQISDDWINSRIFLCLSARNARHLLPDIHLKIELYRIYVLCENKSEEEEFFREKERFGQIRIATSDRKAFIRQLALDMIPSLIEIGDSYLQTNEFDNASRWFQSALKKINQYSDSKERIFVPTIMKKLAKCSR